LQIDLRAAGCGQACRKAGLQIGQHLVGGAVRYGKPAFKPDCIAGQSINFGRAAEVGFEPPPQVLQGARQGKVCETRVRIAPEGAIHCDLPLTGLSA